MNTLDWSQLVKDTRYYQDVYRYSLDFNQDFWRNQADTLLDWERSFQTVRHVHYGADQTDIRWFEEGILNVSVNCLDRHLPHLAQKVAFYWESEDGQSNRRVTYQELYEQVCQVSEGLRALGVQPGDCVTLYLPLIVETVVVMLACARIGAIHSVIFGGFSAQSIVKRMHNSQSRVIITADGCRRNGRVIPLKKQVDQACQMLNWDVQCLVIRHADSECSVKEYDIDYYEWVKNYPKESVAQPMNAEDPLFILYTSGSTGDPKGIVHTTAGYALYAAFTHRLVFYVQPEDIYWCTADFGWITGHTYGVYGPLLNGVTSVLYESTPLFPNCYRWWDIIHRYQVSHFYTAPTALRMLMSEGANPYQPLDSLQVLGSVGEPLNLEAWKWYFDTIGRGQCPIMDTWWQTETGGIMLAPSRDIQQVKPSVVSRPILGVEPVIFNSQVQPVSGEEIGYLCFKGTWPGQARGIYGQPQRFLDVYMKDFPGYYYSGDGAYQDQDGDFHITGRMDDIVIVSGHNIGTAELENCLCSLPEIVEAAIIGVPDEIKGQSLVGFIVYYENCTLEQTDIYQWIRKNIGAIAIPDRLFIVEDLPKTRSGKIMRRLLRQIVCRTELQDTTTLSNPQSLEMIENIVSTQL